MNSPSSAVGIIANYRERLPLAPEDCKTPLTLGEGNTPLVKLQNTPLPKGVELYVKTEGANPTASFKDRGMVVAAAAAKAAGVKCLLCASTGNTSASAAAYAARAGLPCVVAAPAGKVAAGKIAQAVAHGAEILQIDGNFDDAMEAVKRHAESGDIGVVNSINPMRLQGQKTAAFEVIKTLGDAPDYHALPVGNAGNITAHWIGYCEAAGGETAACSFCKGKCPFGEKGASSAAESLSPLSNNRPIMLGYQAENAAPFVSGFPVENPQTVATAIRIGRPQSFDAAKLAAEESGGRIGAVSDEKILAAQSMLAAKEGVFCEPASAASVAGVLADIASGKIKSPARIVCTLTGHGLKDTSVVAAPPSRVVAADEIQQAIGDIVALHSAD